ncbi:MAG: trypsin-like serine protease, partial [Deltaproteobacteria bacterium]|nr:trypsin-like serine protease [Deltaproteobacteria bacterium]
MIKTASTFTISLALALTATGCDTPYDAFDEDVLDAQDLLDADDDDEPLDPEAMDQPDGGELPAGPDALGQALSPEEIIGGFVWDSDTDVLVNSVTPLGIGTCTGTLLRNDVVLTAKHCVSSNGTINGPWLLPSAMTVTQDGPGATLGAQRSVTSIVRQPGEDVALMRLSSPLTIEGRAAGQSNQILATSQEDLIGQAVLCQ